MNRRQRLEAAIGGGVPDRVPVSAWGHFYQHETSAHGLAKIMVDFLEQHDWDFLKVHARASYHVEGWGFTYEASPNAATLHRCTGHPIRDAASWRLIEPLPLDTPALAEQINALRLIKRRVPADLPIIMTVFSPLDVAEKLVDRDAKLLKAHIDEDPSALEHALASIADTFHRFVHQLVAEGVDGVYFSTKWANNVKLTPEQYQRLVKPYDMQVLEASRPMWCNMLHLCEDEVQLQSMAHYPVQVFHWDAHTAHNPALSDGQKAVGRAVGGGVDAGTLARGSAEEVLQRARDSIAETEGKGMVLGPGCSVQVAQTPKANLHALREAVNL